MSKKTVMITDATANVAVQAGDSVTFDSRLPTIDDGMAFFVSQLTAFEARWYKAQYPDVNFGELVDVNTETPEWADEVAFRMYDGVTMGKFIGANADDLPRVAAAAKMFKAPIGYAGNEFEYSLDELRKTAHLGMPLDVSLAELARRGAEEHTQRVVYFGDADRGMTGLFNNPNVPISNSTLDWSTATPIDIIADVNAAITQVWENTLGVHTPNTIAIPANRWTQLSTSFGSAQFPDKSILELLMERNVYTARTGQPLTVVPRFQLQQEELAKHIPGYTGGDRILAYEKNRTNLETHIPMFWRTTAPQPRGLKIVVPAEYKASGVQWRYPMSAVYHELPVRTP